MAEPFKIRQARRTDREAVASLLHELGYPDAADSSTMFWVLNHPEIDVFVAVDHLDRAVGMVSLSHRPQLRLRGRISTIEELVVTRSWRNRGVGSKLLAAAIARAKALSARRVELRVSQQVMEQCPAFFERNGFAACEHTVLRLAELEQG